MQHCINSVLRYLMKYVYRLLHIGCKCILEKSITHKSKMNLIIFFLIAQMIYYAQSILMLK